VRRKIKDVEVRRKMLHEHAVESLDRCSSLSFVSKFTVAKWDTSSILNHLTITKKLSTAYPSGLPPPSQTPRIQVEEAVYCGPHRIQTFRTRETSSTGVPRQDLQGETQLSDFRSLKMGRKTNHAFTSLPARVQSILCRS